MFGIDRNNRINIADLNSGDYVFIKKRIRQGGYRDVFVPFDQFSSPGADADGVVTDAYLFGDILTLERSESLPNLTVDLSGLTGDVEPLDDTLLAGNETNGSNIVFSIGDFADFSAAGVNGFIFEGPDNSHLRHFVGGTYIWKMSGGGIDFIDLFDDSIFKITDSVIHVGSQHHSSELRIWNGDVSTFIDINPVHLTASREMLLSDGNIDFHNGSTGWVMTKQSDGSVILEEPGAAFPGFTDLFTDYGFDDNSIDWDAAFSWGNHAFAGYLTDAPSDGSHWVRKDGAWTALNIPQPLYGLIQTVTATTYTLMISAANAGIIQKVGGKLSAGTCDIEVFINGVALGGGVTSLSTTYAEVTHTTDNVYTAGDVVTMTISNLTGSPANLDFVIKQLMVL